MPKIRFFIAFLTFLGGLVSTTSAGPFDQEIDGRLGHIYEQIRALQNPTCPDPLWLYCTDNQIRPEPRTALEAELNSETEYSLRSLLKLLRHIAASGEPSRIRGQTLETFLPFQEEFDNALRKVESELTAGPGVLEIEKRLKLYNLEASARLWLTAQSWFHHVERGDIDLPNWIDLSNISTTPFLPRSFPPNTSPRLTADCRGHVKNLGTLVRY